MVGQAHEVGVGRRWIAAVLYLFLGALGLLMLTLVLRPQTETGTLEIILSVLWIAMIPVGCAYAWSAFRLHQFHSKAPA